MPISRTVEVATPEEIFALLARGGIVNPTVRSMATLYPRPGIAFVPIADMAPLQLGLIWAAHDNARVRAFAQLAPAWR